MNKSQSTIFPGMEITKEIAFEDNHIASIRDSYERYAQQNDSNNLPNQQIDADAAWHIRNVGMTFSDYMFHALYDPTFGFYSTGNVVFVKKKNKANPSFLTYPVMLSPNFGRMIANQAYGMWCSMLYSKDILPGQTFSIVEFGAGEGILARDILDAITLYAEQEAQNSLTTHWQEFYKVVQYTIGETSPDLRKRQKKLNQKAVSAGKLHIQAADARNLTGFSREKYKGLIVSNELPDAFPVHKIWQMEDGRIKVCVLTPLLSTAWTTKNLDAQEQQRVLQAHDQYIATFKRMIQDPEQAAIYHAQNDPEALAHGFIISASEWLALKKKLSHNKEESEALDDAIYFIELYYDADFFPETHAYVQRHANYISWLGKQTKIDAQKPLWYMNYAAQGYISSTAHLLETGFVITIDYGNNSSIHHNEMLDPIDAIRMYPIYNGSSDRDVYDRPGSYDLTTSINFTDLCMVGIEQGLNTVFYGPQSALNDVNILTAPEKTMIPFDLNNTNFAAPMSRRQKSEFDHSIQESFRMIIQQKSNTKSYYKLIYPSEVLFPLDQ